MNTFKMILTLIGLSTGLSTFAASITVPKFTLNMDVQTGYSVSGEIELACRYEKIVFGDSAQFETFYQTPKKLTVISKKGAGFNSITLVNNEELFFEYDRAFKFGKECRASFKVFFVSNVYALGHGIKPLAPVTFTLWEGFYDYEEGDQEYDLEKMRKYLHQTTYTFTEKMFSNMMHIRILQDGREAKTSPWVEKAYFDPKTGKPFSPKL